MPEIGLQRPGGALAGPGDDLRQARRLAAAHQHPPRDDDGVDDGAAGRVDEVGGELADAELRRVRAQQQEVGGGAASSRVAPSSGARPPVATSQASAAAIAVGSAAACFWARAKA